MKGCASDEKLESRCYRGERARSELTSTWDAITNELNVNKGMNDGSVRQELRQR